MNTNISFPQAKLISFAFGMKLSKAAAQTSVGCKLEDKPRSDFTSYKFYKAIAHPWFVLLLNNMVSFQELFLHNSVTVCK